MHFQIIKDDEVNKLITLLYSEFPEFNEQSCYEQSDEPYLIFGEFGTFTITQIDENNLELLNRIYNFINTALEVKNIDVQNIFVEQIFEKFMDKPSYVMLSKDKLINPALNLFMETLNKFHYE